MPILLSLLRNHKRDVLIVALSGALFVTVQAYRIKKAEAEKMTEAYNHPQVIERVRTVTVQGPIKTVTRIVESPGTKETTIIEDRAAETIVSATDSEKTPIFPVFERKNRVLAGISNGFNLKDVDSYRLWGGYSWGNRLDLLVGVDSALSSEALVCFRF